MATRKPNDPLVCDEGNALFAGLNVVPRRSSPAASSSRVDRRANPRRLEVWSDEAPRAGLPRGGSFDLDFPTVPADSQEEPLEKPHVSSRSRRRKGVLVFLARDATGRVLGSANAGIPEAQQPDEILRSVAFRDERTGGVPAELVFDSQLTTHASLNRLNRRGVRFMTPRRRPRAMPGAIWSRPASAWRRVTLNRLRRTFGTPWVLDERIRLKGYSRGGPVTLRTASDRSFEAGRVVLALGNSSPQDLQGLERPVSQTGYVADPWNGDALSGLERDESIALVGSGLTAIDLVVEYLARGHRGKIIAVSRHGLLPCRHAPAPPRPHFDLRQGPRTARRFLKAVRAEAALCQAEGGDWRSVVDGIRPVAQELWRSLGEKERGRFVRTSRRAGTSTGTGSPPTSMRRSARRSDEVAWGSSPVGFSRSTPKGRASP
jgi:hypothetical protein